MPTRLIYEKICDSVTLAELSADEERLFHRLVVKADDYGRFHAHPSILLGSCFPLLIKSVTVEQIEAWRNRLAEVGLIAVYTDEGREYLQIVTWPSYQRQRGSKPKFPAPSSSGAALPQLAADCGSRVVKTRNPVADSRRPGAGSRESMRAGARGDGADAPPKTTEMEPFPSSQIRGTMAASDPLEPQETEHRLGEGVALSSGQGSITERTETEHRLGEAVGLSAGRGDRKTSGKTPPPERLEPTDAEYRLGETVGLSRGQVDLAAAAMLDHWRGKGERRADWLASLRTWLRNSVKYDRGPLGDGRPTPPGDNDFDWGGEGTRT